MTPTSRTLGVSTSLIGGLLGLDCPEESVSLVANGAITRLEYFALDTPGRHHDPAHVSRMQRAVDAAGLRFHSVHAPFDGCDLSWLEEAHRRHSVESARCAIELAATLGVDLVVLHASGDNVPAVERPQRLEALARSLNELLPRADGLGVRLSAETLPRGCLANRAAELHWLMGAVDGELGVCYDANHITLYEDVLETLRGFGSRVWTLHISDHDGVDERHWIPGRGVTDWPRFVQGLDEIGYAGCLMHEAADPALDLPGNAAAIAEAARKYLAWG